MIIKSKTSNDQGLTLIELLIVTSMLSVIVFSVGYTFVVGMKLWNEGYDRGDIKADISQSFELISKNLRQATSIDTLTESSITFTADLGNGSTSCRIYLYNSSDSEPNPPYSEPTYELRWATGTVTYGSGSILSTDIAQPATAAFSQSSNLITVDLTVTRGDESLRMRSNVRPRNL